MKIKQIVKNGVKIGQIESDEIVLHNSQSAIDILLANMFEDKNEVIIVDKSLIAEQFFDLSTRIAGEILQQFSTYRTKIGIVGDFSIYKSESLKVLSMSATKEARLLF